MQAITERHYTISEAAEMTRLSVAWWRQTVWQKKLRYLKIGRRVFIPESTIKDLLIRSIVEPSKRNEVSAHTPREHEESVNG